MKKKAIVIGNTIWDRCYKVHSARAGQMDKKTITKVLELPGGQALNAARTLAGLGTSVQFISTLGQDLLTDATTQELEHYHIDYSLCQRRNGNLAEAIVLINDDTGQRTIFMSKVEQLINTPANYTKLYNADLIYLDAYHIDYAIDLLQSLQSTDIPVVSDLEYWDEKCQSLLPWVDVLIISKEVANVISPHPAISKQLIDIKKFGPSQVIILDGPNLINTINGKNEIANHQPRKINAIDTTGAGDNFRAAFCHLFLEKLSFTDCIDKAAELATDSCHVLGSRLPDTQIESFIDSL